MSQLTVIFPVETIARELDVRLVLAALWGRPDHRIFVAHASHANRLAAHFPGGGLYVGKHIFASGGARSLNYERIKNNGFTVIQLAEEGAVFMGGPTDWGFDLDWQLQPAQVDGEDYIATWGNWQKQYYIQRGARNPENVRATGHPRFDIYKNSLKNIYLEESKKIRAEFGNYVLLNSNFTWAVNPMGVENTFSRWQGYYPEEEAARIRFVQRWSRQNRVYAEFIELIHTVSLKYKDCKIIIRPHPSDDLRQIQAAVAGVPNIVVLRRGGVVPWILGSQVVLNDGCTTGIEAYLLGKPVVNFTPVTDTQEAFLPNLLGVRASNREEALSAIDEAIRVPHISKELPEIAHELFSNFREDSMQLFIDLLHEAEQKAPKSNAKLTEKILTDQIAFRCTETVKQVARSLFFKRRRQYALATRVLFPGFDRCYIQDRLNLITQITGHEVQCKYYSPWIVELKHVKKN